MGLSKCLICDENFKNNKNQTLNFFLSKYEYFGKIHPVGSERKSAMAELIRKYEQSTSKFSNWMRSSNNITPDSFVVSHKIMKSGKPFTDGEFIKNCFSRMSENLFSDFKNRKEIIKKIERIPLSAKTVCNKIIRMVENVTQQQLYNMKSSLVISLACNESCDVQDIAQLTLIVRYIYRYSRRVTGFIAIQRLNSRRRYLYRPYRILYKEGNQYG